MVRFLMIAGVAGTLAACAPAMAPQSTSSPALDSGVTSSTGGGTQTLGNAGNTGITKPR